MNRPSTISPGEAEDVEIEARGRREVPEWIGAHPDSEIPKRVKLRILIAYGGKCYRTGHKFRAGDPIEFDHIIALANGGQHRERNIAPILGGKPHKEKTASDLKTKGKIDRLFASHHGLRKPKRPFPKRVNPWGYRP
jgi:5-methylcytosine-specific restriction endonuclease McrA